VFFDKDSRNKQALLKNEWVNYNLLTLKVIDSYLYYDDRIISTRPPLTLFPADNAIPMSFNCFGYFYNGSELTVSRPVIPVVK
jgi:hypothetical protein